VKKGGNNGSSHYPYQRGRNTPGFTRGGREKKGETTTPFPYRAAFTEKKKKEKKGDREHASRGKDEKGKKKTPMQVPDAYWRRF